MAGATLIIRKLLRLRDVDEANIGEGEFLKRVGDTITGDPGGGGGLTFPQILAALAAIGVDIDDPTGVVTLNPADPADPAIVIEGVPGDVLRPGLIVDLRLAGFSGAGLLCDGAVAQSVDLTDTVAWGPGGSFNNLSWGTTGVDGQQFVTIQLGAVGAPYVCEWVSSGFKFRDTSNIITFQVLTDGSVLLARAGGTLGFLGAAAVAQQAASTIADLWTAAKNYGLLTAGSAAPDLATQAALDAHTGDTSAAHAASAISILDTANDFTATDVEGALAELQSDAEAHVAAADPHAGYVLESSVSAFIQTLLDDADAATAQTTLGLTPSPYAGRGYKVGFYYIHDTVGVISLAANVIALDTVTAVPFPVRKTTTFDRIAVFQGGNGTANTVHRLGIYNDDGNAYPGTLLLDAGTIAGDAGGAVLKEKTISQQLLPGLYWLVHVNQVATGGTTYNTSTGSIMPHWMAQAAAGINGACYRQTGVTGALGSPFTTTPVLNATGTAMWLRAA